MKFFSKFLIATLALACAAASSAQAPAASKAPGADAPAPVSASAQRIFERSKSQLIQIRTLLQHQSSQSSVGSGFLVDDEGLILTNYHVISSYALDPERHRLTFATTDKQEGQLDLLAFDVVHDLALVRARGGALAKRGHLAFRPQERALQKGEHIYSMGNPLDVGFALAEGIFNGFAERSFYPSIFFGGSLNPGMSGGPALDADGQVIGINVATRRDGQQVSFLVPAEFAHPLLQRAIKATPLTKPQHAEVARQLMTHQNLLVQKFTALPWRPSGDTHYQIPVPSEDFMRCWGNSSSADSKGLDFERSQCQNDQAIFVASNLRIPSLSVRHESYDGTKLGFVRYHKRFAESFRNERFGGRLKTEFTEPQCKENFVTTRDGLPLRVVLCMVAYRKLTGLYNLNILVATQAPGLHGAQARLDVGGLSFDNAMRMSNHFLGGFGWKKP